MSDYAIEIRCRSCDDGTTGGVDEEARYHGEQGHVACSACHGRQHERVSVREAGEWALLLCGEAESATGEARRAMLAEADWIARQIEAALRRVA